MNRASVVGSAFEEDVECGPSGPRRRRLLGHAAGGRNTSAALVTAGASAAEPKAAIMLIVAGVVGLMLRLAAIWARRRDGAG